MDDFFLICWGLHGASNGTKFDPLRPSVNFFIFNIFWRVDFHENLLSKHPLCQWHQRKNSKIPASALNSALNIGSGKDYVITRERLEPATPDKAHCA